MRDTDPISAPDANDQTTVPVEGVADLGLAHLDAVDRVAAKRDVLVEVQLDRLQLREVRSFHKLHPANLRVGQF